ncbi:MAG: Abi family protein [Clostridia bacterium]|nr:Abi family protein [Clostridia bacterium]
MKQIKSINGLMKYLRDKHNIKIGGSLDKQHLKSVGYYHGYKGYRYIKKPSNKLPITDFKEVMAIIDFDNKVKALLYSQVMFIETAIKSYALEIIIQEGKTENFSEIYTNLMTEYKLYSNQSNKYKSAYRKRLDTFNRIQNVIATSYVADNNIVAHYLKNDESIPIWAIFEIITLGEFGHLISTFDKKIRQDISKDIGLNIAFDSNGKLVENIIFAIKDLRNSIAHNNVIFDARFKNRNIDKTLSKAILSDTNVQNVNFKCITDYVILVTYILKKLKKTNKELIKLVNDYNKLIDELKSKIPSTIFNQIILTDDINKLNDLKKFIKK